MLTILNFWNFDTFGNFYSFDNVDNIESFDIDVIVNIVITVGIVHNVDIVDIFLNNIRPYLKQFQFVFRRADRVYIMVLRDGGASEKQFNVQNVDKRPPMYCKILFHPLKSSVTGVKCSFWFLSLHLKHLPWAG